MTTPLVTTTSMPSRGPHGCRSISARIWWRISASVAEPAGFFGEQTHEGAHHIGAADNADEASMIDDGNPLHVPRLHQRDEVGEGSLRRHGDDALRHHLADFATVRMNVFLRQPTRADEERDPSSVALLVPVSARRSRSLSVTMPRTAPSLPVTGRPLMVL
jgi:hypothetical protein